jgi:ankyrin repeat protein
MTPLHEACAAANFDIVKLLLEHGADVQRTDMLGDTPLIMLCDANDSFGTLATLDLLLSYDNVRQQVDLQNKTGDTALMTACENNLCCVAEILLKHHHADVHVQNREGETAAVLALSMGNFEVLEVLFLFGVDVDEVLPGWKHETLLLYSCLFGSEAAVRFLLKLGARVDLTGIGSRDTPLLVAASRGLTSIVTLLLQHDADVDAVDNNMQSALYVACQGGHVETVKVLLYCNPDLEMMTAGGDTALTAACLRGDLMLVQLLQQQGAELDGCDAMGRSVLERAVRAGQAALAGFLLDKGGAGSQLCSDCQVRSANSAPSPYIVSTAAIAVFPFCA